MIERCGQGPRLRWIRHCRRAARAAGCFFRSNDLSRLTAEDCKIIDRLGVRTIIDLWTVSERAERAPPRHAIDSLRPARLGETRYEQRTSGDDR
ncbi:tyrosine-protein phosphatase [Methylocella tundrae]|uniref:tyrosine-protein phosphatase n=1 Tax=Methylocella tundrae TaxID=227605 RepID=UPI003CC7EC91